MGLVIVRSSKCASRGTSRTGLRSVRFIRTITESSFSSVEVVFVTLRLAFPTASST